MENHVQRSSEIRWSFDIRSHFIKSAHRLAWSPPVIYLDVETGNAKHSPINKMHLVLASNWGFQGWEELAQEYEEQRGRGRLQVFVVDRRWKWKGDSYSGKGLHCLKSTPACRDKGHAWMVLLTNHQGGEVARVLEAKREPVSLSQVKHQRVTFFITGNKSNFKASMKYFINIISSNILKYERFVSTAE